MVDLTCASFIFQFYSSREPTMAFRCWRQRCPSAGSLCQLQNGNGLALDAAVFLAHASVPLRGSTRSCWPPFGPPSVVFLGRPAAAHPVARKCFSLRDLNFAEVASEACNLNTKTSKKLPMKAPPTSEFRIKLEACPNQI